MTSPNVHYRRCPDTHSRGCRCRRQRGGGGFVCERVPLLLWTVERNDDYYCNIFTEARVCIHGTRKGNRKPQMATIYIRCFDKHIARKLATIIIVCLNVLRSSIYIYTEVILEIQRESVYNQIKSKSVKIRVLIT